MGCILYICVYIVCWSNTLGVYDFSAWACGMRQTQGSQKLKNVTQHVKPCFNAFKETTKIAIYENLRIVRVILQIADFYMKGCGFF